MFFKVISVTQILLFFARNYNEPPHYNKYDKDILKSFSFLIALDQLVFTSVDVVFNPAPDNI